MASPLKILQTNTFSGAMNADEALELLAPDTYRNAYNIHVLSTGGGHRGVLTNCLGTLEIEFDLPAGTNKTIGRKEDTERNQFYWMNWNSNGYHGIYMYDALLNAVIPILINLTDTGDIGILDFGERWLVLSIDTVLSPKGDTLLYFANENWKAKKFNVQKALDKSPTGYGYNILAEYINAYKLASIFPPALSYATDTSRESNYLYTYLFKAAVRHLYDDGEKNNWSEFSTVPLPLNEGFSGNPTVSNVNNRLEIVVETGSSIVTHVEIAIQISGEPFVSIIVLDKARLGISDDTTYNYLFYNDNASYSGLDQLNVYRAYSFLQLDPATQSFTNNSMVYGKGLEGFTPVDINVETDVIYTDAFVPDDTVNEMNDPDFIKVAEKQDRVRLTPVFGIGNGYRRNVWVKLTIGADVKSGNKFELFGRNGESDNLYFYYTATNSDDAISVANAFKQQLNTTGRILSGSEDLPNSDIWANEISVGGDVTFTFILRGRFKEQFTSFTTRVNPVSTATLKDSGQSLGTHKSGGTVKYGIVYWDEDTRRSNTFTSDACVTRTDFVTQTSGYKQVVHEITVKNIPPVWAKYWEVVRTQDLTYGNDFIHILIQKAIDSQSTTTTKYVDLVIGSLYTYQEMYPNTVVAYEFEKNDRIRLIKKETSGTFYTFIETVVLDFKPVGTTETINEDVTTDNTSTVTIGGITTSDNIGRYIVINSIEREIIAVPSGTTYTLDRPFGTAEKYASFQIVDKRGILRVLKPINIDIEDNSLIEVYKPTQNVESAQKNFRLFGKKFAIKDWGTDLRSHTGDQNQDPLNPITTPAIVNIVKGTTYIRNQEFPTNNQIPGTQVLIDLKEDSGYSDFYVSDLNDNGKIAPEDEGSGQIRFGSRLRHSSNYIEGTRINGLNDFDNVNREDYNDPFGDIMLTKYREGLLYIFKFLRNCYTPILANIIVDEQGQQILGTSNKLLNKLQYFAWEGGCGNNPESYASDQTWQYILSPNSGVDCKLGGNGVLPISEQFFLDTPIRGYIKQSTNNSGFVFGDFDRTNGDRILAFEAYNEYLYNTGFSDATFETYDADLPSGTVYQITTQPTNGVVTIDVDGNFAYTPNLNFVGSDPFYYRWMVPAGAWTAPKKECMTVTPLVIPVSPAIFYNVLYSENFTKNDCDPGYHGSIVAYIVPALKYSSPFSQINADLQAEEEAATYGQQYANDNGTCAINPPNAFTYTDQTGLNINTLTESDSQVITGSYSSYPITVNVGEYQIDGGAWTSIGGIVPNGSSVKLRNTTSGSYSTGVNMVVNIGGVTDTWTITTKVAPSVTINYSNTQDLDPYTLGVLIYVLNGVEQFRQFSNTSGTVTVPAGSSVQFRQVSFPAFTPWADNSTGVNTARLLVTNGATTMYDNSVTVQVVELHGSNYSFTVLEAGVYTIAATTVSTMTGFTVNNLRIENYLNAGEIEVQINDNTTSNMVIHVSGVGVPQAGISDQSFNVLTNADLMTVIVPNLTASTIDYSIAGNGYLQTGTIAGMSTLTKTDVPKGNVVVSVSPTSNAIPCGSSTSYSGGQTYPTMQVVTLGSGVGGTVTLNFNAYTVPDKFIVMFDGVEVINTGYRGSTSEQSNLDAALATYGAPPETITSPGSGSATFVKGTATTTATVYVYAPMSGTAWDFLLSCPV